MDWDKGSAKVLGRVCEPPSHRWDPSAPFVSPRLAVFDNPRRQEPAVSTWGTN